MQKSKIVMQFTIFIRCKQTKGYTFKKGLVFPASLNLSGFGNPKGLVSKL